MASFKNIILALALLCNSALGSVSCKVRDDLGLPQQLENFIGGEFVAPVNGIYSNNFGPADGSLIGTVPASSAEDVHAAIKTAKKAQDIWGSRSVTQRAAVLKMIADKLEEKAEEFARAESLDMGKPLESSAGDDMKRQVRNLNYHAEAAVHYPGQSSVMETDPSFEKRPGESSSKSFLNYVTRYPIGVVGVIAHWSRPLHQTVWRLAPALMAGNAVVVKPPSATPITAYLLAKVLAEIPELPKGIVSIVFGSGDSVGGELARHRAIGAIAMVGGVEAAASIQANAAATQSMKKLKFDLGNNHAMVVAPDADLDALLPVAMTAAWGCDAGQRAHSLGRLILHKDIAAKFTKMFVDATRLQVTLGSPVDSGASMGPLVSADQVRKLELGVSDLIEGGGELLLGSAETPAPSAELSGGYWMAPVIVGGFGYERKEGTCEMGCGKEDGGDYDYDQGGVWAKEHQGPVVKVIVVDSLEDAAHAANAGPDGLSASVWAGSVDTAHSLAHAIDAGYVWVNNWLARDLAMPFGGWKESGNGHRSGGQFDVDFYTYSKTTCVEISGRHKMTGKEFA